MARHLGFSFANTGACAQAQVHHSLLPGGLRKLHTPLTLQLSKSIAGEYRAGLDEFWRGCCESKGYGYMLYFIVLYVSCSW